MHACLQCSIEQNVASSDAAAAGIVAKTMLLLLVRGLCTSLQFPYAQFACRYIKACDMYQPVNEAILQLENIGLKVRDRVQESFYYNRVTTPCRYLQLQQMAHRVIDFCSICFHPPMRNLSPNKPTNFLILTLMRVVTFTSYPILHT